MLSPLCFLTLVLTIVLLTSVNKVNAVPFQHTRGHTRRRCLTLKRCDALILDTKHNVHKYAKYKGVPECYEVTLHGLMRDQRCLPISALYTVLFQCASRLRTTTTAAAPATVRAEQTPLATDGEDGATASATATASEAVARDVEGNEVENEYSLQHDDSLSSLALRRVKSAAAASGVVNSLHVSGRTLTSASDTSRALQPQWQSLEDTVTGTALALTTLSRQETGIDFLHNWRSACLADTSVCCLISSYRRNSRVNCFEMCKLPTNGVLCPR